MKTRSHVHREDFDESSECLFALLHTPSSIREWWGASVVIVVPEVGGSWAAAWGSEDDPDYVTVATIHTFEPPKRLVLADYRYFAKSGPLPFRADFTTEFLVRQGRQNASLQVSQNGFPTDGSADDYLDACASGWQKTFAGIRAFLNNLPSPAS